MKRSHDDLYDEDFPRHLIWPKPQPVSSSSSQAVSSEERQLDEKYRKLVMQRQIINNQRQRVSSLQDLTLDVVINIVKECAHDKQGPRPLDVLTEPLLGLVYGKLTGEDMLHFDIVKQVITERSQQVAFYMGRAAQYEPPWTPWTQDQVTSILALLDKCKNQLSTLKVILSRNLERAYGLDGVPMDLESEAARARPSLPQLHELLQNQINLRELRLSCDINDQTLALISSTCHNLRVLDIRNNEAVTNEGLEHLSEGPEGKPSNITYLNVSDTNVSPCGVAQLMVKLQAQIEYVEADRSIIGAALAQLSLLDPPIMLPRYKKLSLNFFKAISVTYQFAEIVKLMPDVPTLHLIFCPDVTPLFTLTKVTSVKLNVGPSDLLAKLILQWSNTLTCVKLTNNSNIQGEIDFSVFAQCPNLEELTVQNLSPQVETNHKLLPSSFSKLRKLCFYFWLENKFMPEVIVTKMLTSKCLEKFDANFAIKDHVIRSVISEVHTNPEIFSNLKVLKLYNTSEFTFDTWIQLLCVLPNNAEIIMNKSDGRISDEWLGKLQAFVHRNNIKACILTQ